MRRLGEAELRLTEQGCLHHTRRLHPRSLLESTVSWRQTRLSWFVPREFPLPPSAVYTSMTGGEGHEPPYLDLISSTLEGSGGSGCSALSTHRHQFRPLLTSIPLLSGLYTSNTGGMFYIGCSIGFSPFVKFFQLSIHD
jgi:hypothetical protein